MATAEETEIEVNITSDDIERTYICQPCEDEGELCTAVGFCVDCHEYLCQRCYDGHLIPSLTKKHKLLDAEHMTEFEFTTHSCQQHPDREVEYHCPTHSFLGCQLCYSQHKDSCADILCIQEVCDSTPSSEEFANFTNKLANITSKCIKLQKEIKCNLQTITTNHSEVIDKVKGFKQDIIDIVNKLEKDLVEKADKAKKEETVKMTTLSQRVRTLLKHTKDMTVTTEKLKNKEKITDLYIELVQSKDILPKFENQIRAIESDNKFKQFEFKANKEMADILESLSCIGGLRLKGSIAVKVEHERDIFCKSGSDVRNCEIMGVLSLPNQRLLVSDYGTDNTVKLIDIKQNKILSVIKLPNHAYGLCKITDTLVAVTLTSAKKIVFLRIHQTLSVEREIAVNGYPYGIDYLDDKLIVSYSSSPYRVEIMDMQGKVISTFVKDSNGQDLFNYPSHLAINPHNELIYVSNHNSHSVLCMKFDGTMVATYKDYDLTHPRQVTFDSRGMVYVCAEGSHNVHQITEDCIKVKVIIPSTDGLQKPLSICYQENEDRLCIGQNECNSIKVYQMKCSYL